MKTHLKSHVKHKDLTQTEANEFLNRLWLPARPASSTVAPPPPSLSNADINENLIISQMLYDN